MNLRFASALLLAAGLLAQPKAPQPAPAKPGQQALPADTILKAMIDELVRSRALALLERPYFIEYQIEDADMFSASATMGALLNANRVRFRVPQLQVRVGDYDFDNTNHVTSGFASGGRDSLPIDDRYDVLRRFLWLGTDRAYKGAIESISRKRGSMRNLNPSAADKLPDFTHGEPLHLIRPVSKLSLDDEAWKKRSVTLSAVFRNYPEVADSSVDLVGSQATSYYINSEGAVERTPDGYYEMRVRASARAADGMVLRSSWSMPAIEAGGMASDEEMQRAAKDVADEVKALVTAPAEDTYAGPVLFDARASAQLFAQALGDNLRATRRPVADAGRQVPYLPSEFESKIGARVLPEWMDVVDDPTQSEWRGHKLAGHYLVDMEGIAPSPVVAVDKGVLKSFLMTRQPVKGFAQTNGHARLPGGFGTRSAAIGNLFIRSSQAKPFGALKAQLIEMCKQRGKPYGLLVRKLDYPSTMSFMDFQELASGAIQGGGARPVSPPVLAYRVYPDGREELVRGLRFKAFSTRALRDIMAASDENYVFDFVNNGAPLALVGAGAYIAPSTVVAPAVLFEDLEFERGREDNSKPPVVPPPPIE